MPDHSNPVFYDVKREEVPTDVEFFAMDQDIAAQLQESEIDRAARLEVIHGLVAERDTLLAERSSLVSERDALLAERAALIAERSAVLIRADTAERKLGAIRRFIPWQWIPGWIRMRIGRLIGLSS